MYWSIDIFTSGEKYLYIPWSSCIGITVFMHEQCWNYFFWNKQCRYYWTNKCLLCIRKQSLIYRLYMEDGNERLRLSCTWRFICWNCIRGHEYGQAFTLALQHCKPPPGPKGQPGPEKWSIELVYWCLIVFRMLDPCDLQGKCIR